MIPIALMHPTLGSKPSRERASNVRCAALGDGLTRRIGLDRKSVQLTFQLLGQRLVDHAMALDARAPLEGLGDDQNAKVALARSRR